MEMDRLSRDLGSCWLLNVLLETGFEYEDGEIAATQTALKHLKIKHGIIAEITDILPEDAINGVGVDGVTHYDAGGMLLLPACREMHIHLDKTFYGGPWRAVRPAPNGVFDRIAEEQALLPKLLPTAQERAEALIRLIVGNGSTFVRTHCNIDPVIGLQNLESLLRALDQHSDALAHEIVAFPQHGLLRSDSAQLLRDAMSTGRVSHVGGLDPTAVDGNMERSLDTMVQIAVDYSSGIDIHLHEGGNMGLSVIRRLADMTEDAGLQGKVTVSHAFALASMSESEAVDMTERLASLGISIASSVPNGQRVMPIPMLLKHGVEVLLGNDSIIDHWSPFGTGDTLQKAQLCAQLYGWSSEYGLSRALALATGGVTPLDDAGSVAWPKAGDAATGMLVAASCSAEAVARLPRREVVLHRGQLAAGELKRA